MLCQRQLVPERVADSPLVAGAASVDGVFAIGGTSVSLGVRVRSLSAGGRNLHLRLVEGSMCRPVNRATLVVRLASMSVGLSLQGCERAGGAAGRLPVARASRPRTKWGCSRAGPAPETGFETTGSRYFFRPTPN